MTDLLYGAISQLRHAIMSGFNFTWRGANQPELAMKVFTAGYLKEAFRAFLGSIFAFLRSHCGLLQDMGLHVLQYRPHSIHFITRPCGCSFGSVKCLSNPSNWPVRHLLSGVLLLLQESGPWIVLAGSLSLFKVKLCDLSTEELFPKTVQILSKAWLLSVVRFTLLPRLRVLPTTE